MILFSILVHEKPEVVLDQIENFQYFNPNSYIILHVSAWMSDNDLLRLENAIKQTPSVYINSTRIWSWHGDGSQLKMHVSNFLYFLEKIRLDFDYFCMHASNDMFVKHWLSDFIDNYDAGFRINDMQKWWQMRHAKHDNILRKIMKQYRLNKIVWGQLEGSFYKKNIMETIISRITWGLKHRKLFTFNVFHARFISVIFNIKFIQRIIKNIFPGFIYAKEEIYFMTLSQDLIASFSIHNYCYMNWEAWLKITTEEIDNIVLNNWNLLPIYSSYDFSSKDFDFFAVKRVDRNMADPIRNYIRNLWCASANNSLFISRF